MNKYSRILIAASITFSLLLGGCSGDTSNDVYSDTIEKKTNEPVKMLNDQFVTGEKADNEFIRTTGDRPIKVRKITAFPGMLKEHSGKIDLTIKESVKMLKGQFMRTTGNRLVYVRKTPAFQGTLKEYNDQIGLKINEPVKMLNGQFIRTIRGRPVYVRKMTAHPNTLEEKCRIDQGSHYFPLNHGDYYSPPKRK